MIVTGEDVAFAGACFSLGVSAAVWIPILYRFIRRHRRGLTAWAGAPVTLEPNEKCAYDVPPEVTALVAAGKHVTLEQHSARSTGKPGEWVSDCYFMVDGQPCGHLQITYEGERDSVRAQAELTREERL